MDIFGKVVIVTGASAGIGLATARSFARRGAKTVLVARNGDVLDREAESLCKEGCVASAIKADMRVKAEVERVVSEVHDQFGRLDVLINNAGQAVAGDIASLDPDQFQQILDLNVFGVLYATQAAVPKMRQQGGGVIINVSSMVTSLRIPGISAYTATKSALEALSHTARVELAKYNIRVVTMYPGQTATEFGEHTLGAESAPKMDRDGRRYDAPEEVAEKILEAVRKEPRDQFMNVRSRLLHMASAIAPGVVDRLLMRRMRARTRRAPVDIAGTRAPQSAIGRRSSQSAR